MWPLLEEALEYQKFELIVFAGDILESEEREGLWQELMSTGTPSKKKQTEDEDEGVIDELVYREFFVNLTGFGTPVVFVPGHIDSPTSRLKEITKSFPQVHNVEDEPYEMGGYTFIGRGGAIGPADSDGLYYCHKDKTFKKHIKFETEPEKTILLAHNPPVSRVAVDTDPDNLLGSPVVNELLEKHQPAFCLCGHAHSSPGQDTVASTLVINPGPMFKGRYAVIDLDQHRVIFPTPLKV